MKIGSLFDGSGGFPLAGVICGMEPVWASEIEPYPLRVTAARFPHMTQLGDVTKINGTEIEPVDVITFGSPCQDLSVAGKQVGIHDGARSSLFFEAVRIIKEMRANDAVCGRPDEHVRPRFAVWENVPGAFSSNKGADFRAVLQALAEVVGGTDVHVPMPEKGKWKKAGCIVGDGWSIAWRQYDAQHWGVPQRRKRIYLIADFASERAGEILFEREGVRGNIAAGHEAWKNFTAHAAGSFDGSGADGKAVAFHLQQDPISVTISPCIGGQHQATVGVFMGGQGEKSGSIAYSEECCPTLRASESGTNQVPDVVYAIEGNTVDRASAKNGKGWCEGVSPTLNTQDRHAVTYVPSGNHCGIYEETETSATLTTKYHYGAGGDAAMVVYDCRGNGNGEIVPTLTGDHQNRVTDYTSVVCGGNGQLNNISMAEKANALDCMHDQQFIVAEKKDRPRKYIVRRLTPLECCRLQGFPDWWEDGVEGSDSARYKMWGNGIALPCAVDVLWRIANA